MADNLQDFLRKAAERRQQQSGQAPPPAQAEPVQAEPVHPQVRRPLPPIEILEAEPVPIESVSETVSSHVEKHLDTTEYDRRADRLGDAVEQKDLGAKLHETFDHSVGNLSRQSVADDKYESKMKAADAAYDAAYEVADVDYFEATEKQTSQLSISDIFKSPQNLMQAFIFSEIIRPPTDRWEG